VCSSDLERLFRKSRGQAEDGAHYFNEIVVFSTNLIHVFMRSKKRRDQAMVFVCRASANVGMVIAKSRVAAPDVDAAA
jgi:hypothetical protein